MASRVLLVRSAVCIAFVTGAWSIGASGQTAVQVVPRDLPAPVPAGTAGVSGIVVTNEPTPVPIRRARVTLRPDLTSNGWSVTTDDEGRFVMRGVAAGRHTLEVSKPAWLTTSYGAARPGRPGTPIVVADGARIENITLRMSRAGVIAGTVVDRSGRPVPGVGVSALSYAFSQVTGERSLGRQSMWAAVTTDDQGNYRAFGLPPGEYVVVATLRSGPPAALMDLRRLAEGEVDRVLSQGPAFVAAGAASAGQDPTPLVGFAPVYFPGTADPSRAVTFVLAAGEERGGVNITLDPVPTARVEVAATMPEGVNPASLQVYLVSSSPVAEGATGMVTGRRGPDGFSFAGVTPGAYTVVARAAAQGAGGGGRGQAAGPLTHYATADLVADGTDISVPIALRPGVTIKGRLTFAGETPAGEKELAGTRVHLIAARSGPALTVLPASVNANAAFEFNGVPSGRFRLAFSRPAVADRWTLKTVTLAGRAIDDYIVDVSGGEDVQELVLAFTDRPSELAGRLETSTGRPAPDYYIVAFSANRAHWVPLSNRIAQVRPGTDGRFALRGLPAGDYYLAALTDLAPGEWYDPKFLDGLVPAAVKLAVREGERSVQDLRIK
jgi:hypothetical protein